MTSVRATSAATSAWSVGSRAGRRRRVQRGVHVGEADGPTDVPGRRSGERPNSRADAAGPGAEPASIESSAWRSCRTPTPARVKAPGCNGGQYGPPSPRFAEVPPFYNTRRMNRHDGPEDQSLGDRCMLGVTPDFNGFRRIVQGPGLRRDRRRHRAGPGLPARGLSEREPSAEQHPPPPRRLARPLRGQHAGRRDHEFLAEVPVPRRRGEPEARRTVHAGGCRHDGVRGHDHGPDGLDGALDGPSRS